MADSAWFVRRLKAMSMPEVAWRVSQKALQKSEEKRFKVRKSVVTGTLFNEKLSALQLDAERMKLNWDNYNFSLNTGIPLLGGYDYEIYKKQWNAGFQTKREWPEQFSYALEYKQRDSIGDARTNWELNRHFQFALLAKDYAASRDTKYLTEFKELFEDWNAKNPFLWGISWTSVMEVAIRCSNWCFTWCFLKKANVPEDLLTQLRNGILNMTDYIANHYSRYSSANNHLIVEAFAIGQTGILCDYQPWVKLAVEILTRELLLQNYSDGVNKELSLHYQLFYMEAMGLMLRILIKNNIKVPGIWKPMLEKMCAYVADCMGDYGELIVFGDNDEGKLLDLCGGLNHYQYVLGMFSIMLDRQYVNLREIDCENLTWLFHADELCTAQEKSVYIPPFSACYKEGGNTILRSKTRNILIGIDHAALGFGSIAAHGHADALSFQMFVEGQPVFIDPGTYIYHCDLDSRNAFRRTENHNTVCIDGKDQSEILGAFLWGKRAECRLLHFENQGFRAVIEAEQDGYRPVIHRRRFEFDGERNLKITDTLLGAEKRMNAFSSLILSDKVQILRADKETASIEAGGSIVSVKVEGGEIWIADTLISHEYGVKRPTNILRIKFHGLKMTANIDVEEKNESNCAVKAAQ